MPLSSEFPHCRTSTHLRFSPLLSERRGSGGPERGAPRRLCTFTLTFTLTLALTFTLALILALTLTLTLTLTFTLTLPLARRACRSCA